MDAKLAQLHVTLENAIRGMTLNDLTRHSGDKWTAAEILEHLNLTYIGTARNFERCLASGRPRASADRRSQRWARIVVTWLGYFPPGRKSPDRMCPRGTPAQQVTNEILQNLARMDAAIRESETRFGKHGLLADHPALGPLTAAEWRKFHLVHGMHHAKQILRLRENR